MLTLLKHPYYFETSRRIHWKRSFAISLFVFLFLFIFRPFGLQSYPGNFFPIALGYGGVTLLMLALYFQLMYPAFPKFFHEEKWTLGREILSTLLVLSMIGLGNAFYTNLAGLGSFSISSILWIELYTLLVGVFPTVSIVVLKEKMLSKKYAEESEIINREIETKTEPKIEINQPEPAQREINIVSETGKEDFSLLPDDFWFIKAADNYAEVYFKKTDKLTRKVIRGSLKTIEKSLVQNPEIYRCHKSYLVNLKKVKHVSGNAQGYKLHLEDCEEMIPVSRKLNSEIKELLSAH